MGDATPALPDAQQARNPDDAGMPTHHVIFAHLLWCEGFQNVWLFGRLGDSLLSRGRQPLRFRLIAKELPPMMPAAILDAVPRTDRLTAHDASGHPTRTASGRLPLDSSAP